MSEGFKEQKSGFGAAVAIALLVPLNIFVMPVTIWHGAKERLGALGKDGLNKSIRETEMAVFSWLKHLFDSFILFSWPIIIIIAISVGSTVYRGAEMVPGILFSGYFSPIILSLIKEMISVGLILVLNVEKIERNTHKGFGHAENTLADGLESTD